MILSFGVQYCQRLSVPICSTYHVRYSFQYGFLTVNATMPISQVLIVVILAFQPLSTHIILPFRNRWWKVYIYREREESLNMKYSRNITSYSRCEVLIQLRSKNMNNIRFEVFYDVSELFLIVRPKNLVASDIVDFPQVEDFVLLRLRVIRHRIVHHTILNNLLWLAILTECNS